MGIQGFGRYKGSQVGANGWDGCRGGPGTDLDGLGWYGMSGMGLEGLGWVRRA